MHYNFSYIGEFSALAAALFWSIAVILFKSVGDKVSPIVLNPLKNSIAFLIFIITFIIIDIPFWYEGLDYIDYIKLIISGALGMGIVDTIYLHTLNIIGANRSAILSTLEPGAVFIMSYIMLGTLMTSIQFIGFCIVIISLLIIAYENDIEEIDTYKKRKAIYLQIFLFFCSAFNIVLIKPVLDKLNHSIPLQLWAVMFRLFPGVLITLFFLMLQKNKLSLLEPLKEKHISLRIFMGATIGTFMALSFWILGYSNIKYPPVASLLGQTSCIFIILLAWIALKESISKKRMAAMAVSIIGVFLVIIGG